MKTAVGGRSGAIVVAALVLISSLAVLVSVPRVSASRTVTATATASQSEKNQVSPFTSLSGLYPDTSYLNKISVSLKDMIMQNPEQVVRVTVYTTDPAALGRTLRAMGVDTPVGKAPSKSTGLRPVIVDMPAVIAAKIAYLDSVGGVSLFVVPQPLEILNPESENGRQESPDSAAEPGVNTIRAAQGHHVTDAWARGFTGSDVRVAILDSGVDFANPDLLGTWAIEENTSSPYYLWPIAFDPFSMYVYLYFGGASYPAAPSWYVDTSFNATADVNGLLPLFNDRNYNVTSVPSASGWYHLGVHPAPTLAARFGSHSPGVLLTDSAVPFVYDTIYVDLNDDDNFLNDKPVDIFSPISYADYRDASTGGYDESSWDWGDGMPDVSGGLIYFIANGVNPIPYSDVVADRYGLINTIPGNGNLTAFMIGDAYAAGGDHGTMCSSAVVAQNVTGRVQGFAPDARIVAVGDIYFGGFWTDIYPFAAEGYDGVPGTGDEAMVSSSSYGTSNVDNDGWDYESRFIDLLTSYYDGTTYVASTGNGGYGFGTVTPPGGSKSVISVGASTSYYSGAKTTWENGPMWTFGDVQPWSNRGPSSLGNVDPDVVTVGAWASGDNAINTVSAGQSNGTNSWSIWGGTSLSSPATAGIVALIYDAYEQGASVYPTNTMVKEFLMNGADNINYDPLVMGAGLTNAERSTMLANGLYGVRASPSSWTPGGYRGTDYPSFAHVMSAGDTTWKDFQLTNRGGSAQQWSISDAVLRKAGERTFDIWSNNSDESSPSSNRPDYLWNVSAMLSAYPTTKFVRGIAYTDFASFDPEYDYTMNSAYRALFYDWKDLNGNGLYWDDLNGNGVVNSGELDNVGGQVEYMRFTYAYGFSNVQNAFVHDPFTRVDDALLFGVIHRYRDPAIPSTRVHVVLEFYELADSAWITEDKATVTLGAGATQTLRVTVSVPPTAAVGVYSAMVILKDTGSNETVIPIVINVAGNSQDITFQEDTSNTSYYDNGRMYGGQDWSWRPEAGDWRFYFMDVPDSTPITGGTRFLIHTKWNNYPTDIDTLLFGPTPDDFSNAMPSLFGPYALSQVGGSPNMNIGAGTWLFNTATGGPEEWVSGPAANGLHEIALHNVLYAGEGPSEVFSGATGFVNVNPFPWTEQLSQSSGVKTFDFMSTMDMPDGMEVRAYGVSEPTTYVYPITQDERVSFLVDSVHAGLMDITLTSAFPIDLDLYVYYELPGGGEVPVGSSTSPTANERVKLTLPDDGTYRIEVHGFTVPMPGATFDLTVDLRAGLDLDPANVPSGPIVANTPYTFDIDYDIPDVEGDYYGVIFIGPMGAPTTIEMPVLLMARDTTPPTITLNSPSAGIDYRTSDVPIIDVSFDDVRGAFYSGVDMNSILLTLDGRDVTSSARIVAGELWWNLTFLLSEGQHTVDIQMYDLATTPNLASLMFTFGVDNSAPIIVLTSPAVSITNQPAVNVVGYTESTIATVLINGVPTATTNGAFSSSTNLVEGPNTIQIEATDLVGNTALLHKDIELDTQPPALTVTSPTAGSYIKERTVVVAGTTERGASVVIEGINAAVNNVGDFAVTIALKEGSNSIRVVATDPASNAHVEIIGVTVDTVSPAVTITSPTGAYTNNPALTVSGQTEPSATVAVNSAPVAVAGDGSFTTTVGLGSDGGKNIWVNATDVAGNMAAVLKTITLDTVAPTLAIAMPAPLYQTTVPSVEVRGTTEPSATITVNGQMAMVDSTGGFDTIVALLVDGVNTIYITATDQAGNTNQQTRDVTYIAPDIAGLQNQITLLLGMINDLNNQIDNLDNQIADMNDTINQQSQDITNVNNQLTTIQGRLDALNQTSGDIRTLKSDLDGLGNVLMMGMVLLIVMLFVGLIGMYFAISRKIRALQGPQEDLGEIEEEEELQPEKQQPKQMPKEEKRAEKKVEIEEAETEEEDEI
jgi:TolA-binding protein